MAGAVVDAAGRVVASASTVVLASAGPQLLGTLAIALPLVAQAAQVSSVRLQAWPGPAPRLPLTGNGYLSVAIDGHLWFGASDIQGGVPAGGVESPAGLDNAAQRRNLNRLAAMLPELPALEASAIGGRRAWRWTTADRLPLIGAVADANARGGRLDQPRLIERVDGLYACLALGSRGVASALLGAEIIAAAVTGAPQPVATDLLDAVDPARFLSRSRRRAWVQPPVGPIAGGSAVT